MTPTLQQRLAQLTRMQRQNFKRNECILSTSASSCIHTTLQDTSFNDSSTWNLLSNTKRNKSTTSNEIGLRKVLIANRGEIACRVQQTCHKWNIPTVAIYSTADTSNALHAQMASESYQIGTGPAVSDSYLRMDDIISIALNSDCDSIHPGYGFLSENSKFAQKCIDSGIKFIGPSASAITLMGDKAQSKASMDQAGVPTTPGYYYASEESSTDNQNTDFLYTKAMEIGFPLLIKAVAGGGGKGMRIVWNENDFGAALVSCKNEAYNNFGNSTVLLEKYLVKPRHIEMQIIADTHGNVIHLNERDCSVQRRHQKVFEEAPAIDLHNDLRIKFGQMAIKAAQAVQYVNAGTVEFLLDTSTIETIGTAEQQFYFCEMNTRLQVEHPITELTTGIDLVEWQLRVAAGQTLPITNQSNISCNGHAIEARIYAERQTADGNGFLPATGTLWYHNYDVSSYITTSPTSSNRDSVATTVRVDTGLRRTNVGNSLADEGNQSKYEQAISVYYDPMISKLIVHGPDRSTALKQLIHSLQGYHIAGVPTNIQFLVNCAQHPKFQSGGQYVTTGFLDDYGADVKVTSSASTKNELCQVIGSFALMLHLESRTSKVSTTTVSKKLWSTQYGSWRIGANNIPKQTIQMKDGMSDINIWKYKDGSYDVEPVGGTKYHIDGWIDSKTNTMEVVIDKSKRIRMTTLVRVTTDTILDDTIRIQMWPKTMLDNTEVSSSSSSSWELDVMNPMISHASATTIDSKDTISNGIVKSPMPGKVTRINYNVGDTVNCGDVVIVMEAMKMEHPLIASCNGTIQSIQYNVNDIIMKDGSIVFVIQPTTSEGEVAA